jgi:hypothetical protein
MSIEALNWAWEQPVAKAANKLVLLALADHANGDGECWPSMKRIADRSDISARHVSRAINELVDLGLVEKANRRRHGGQYRGWDYRLLIQQTPAASGHGRPVTSGHGRPSPADTGVRSEPSENRKEEPLAAAPREAPTRKADDLFETVAQVCGISLDGITRTARGQLNKAVKELREVQATPNRSTTKPRHTAPNTPTPPSPQPPSPNTGPHSPSSNGNSNAHPYGTPTSHRSTTDGNLLVLPRIPGRSPTVQNPPGRSNVRTGSTETAPSRRRIPMGHRPCPTDRVATVPPQPEGNRTLARGHRPGDTYQTFVAPTAAPAYIRQQLAGWSSRTLED